MDIERICSTIDLIVKTTYALTNCAFMHDFGASRPVEGSCANESEIFCCREVENEYIPFSDVCAQCGGYAGGGCQDGVVECEDPPGQEDCTNALDDDCDGVVNDGCPETCGNGFDDDGDGLKDEEDAGCVPEYCGNGIDDDGDGQTDEGCPTQCDQCGRCDGQPVDLLTRQMYVGPHDDAQIAAPFQGATGITLARNYDSKIARDDWMDYAGFVAGTGPSTLEPRLLGPGWRHSYQMNLMLDCAPHQGCTPNTVVLEMPGHTERFIRDTTVAAGPEGASPTGLLLAARCDSSATWARRAPVSPTSGFSTTKADASISFSVGLTSRLGPPCTRGRAMDAAPPTIRR